ncbi:MAG: DUF4007 family protein [Armatimonadetes bacterium]|nr:DUF4007 family protein [Armatimonadota bacterium]
MEHRGLTATMHFAFTTGALRRALGLLAGGELRSFGRDPELSQSLGLGTVQVEALGAWMRFAGLTRRSSARVELTPLGRLIFRWDSGLDDVATWWVLHWELSSNYVVWNLLAHLEYRTYTLAELDEAVQGLAEDCSPRTARNARLSLVKALEDTPLGQQLGIVRLESDGKKMTGLTKLAVRHGQAPTGAVGYALADWARRRRMTSAALETLAARGGPGGALHMSAGVLERYLLEIDAAFGGQVLTYSLTAGLNETYFKEVSPLQILAAHYLRQRGDLGWREAFQEAARELGDGGTEE